MNSDKSNLFNSYNTKPKHLLKYQSIFKELLDNQNLFGNNENEKQKKQTSKDFFHIHNNPMKNALYSTRYQEALRRLQVHLMYRQQVPSLQEPCPCL